MLTMEGGGGFRHGRWRCNEAGAALERRVERAPRLYKTRARTPAVSAVHPRTRPGEELAYRMPGTEPGPPCAPSPRSRDAAGALTAARMDARRAMAAQPSGL